jgi:hypothetical protein
MGIAGERSCASVLVIPRRKTTLVTALHGRAAMAGVGAPWPSMGSSPERGEGGKGRGEKQGGAWAASMVGRKGAPWGGSWVRREAQPPVGFSIASVR